MDGEFVTKVVIAVLSSGALSALVSGIFSLIKDKRGTGRMVVLLAGDRLYEKGKKICEQDFVDGEEYKQYCEMYKCYKELDGNGYADGFKSRMDKLPIK